MTVTTCPLCGRFMINGNCECQSAKRRFKPNASLRHYDTMTSFTQQNKARNIIKELKHNGVSQTQLAKAIGVTPHCTRIWYESGGTPSSRILSKLIDYYENWKTKYEETSSDS